MIDSASVVRIQPLSETNGTYYRLITLWVMCEALLGGIIHGLRLPVSGLVVGSCAIICICLIAWYVPAKGSIIKATLIVAIFKMLLSPQAPPPAYIAVFLQGLLGELLFWNRKGYAAACVAMGMLALVESGLQRILVLTIIYGNNLWAVVNDAISALLHKNKGTNFSFIIGSAYVTAHLVMGALVGSWAARLPKRISRWRASKQYAIMVNEAEEEWPIRNRKQQRIRTGAIILWVALIGLYVQSHYHIGKPLLPSHISLEILIRSLIILLAWAFVVGPLLTRVLHFWLKNEQSRSQQDVQEVLRLLPASRQLAAKCWKRTAKYGGWTRINEFGKMVLVNALTPLSVLWREVKMESPSKNAPLADIFILSAPVQTGKTNSLVNWSANRRDVYGILSPVVRGERMFMDARSRERFQMEACEDEEWLGAGRYNFSRNNFEKAAQIIRDAIHEEGWLVIDEIGPLELRGEGFSQVLQEVLTIRQERILLVVRDKDETVAKVKSLVGARKVAVLNDIERLPEPLQV